jgi:hypothetical protein
MYQVPDGRDCLSLSVVVDEIVSLSQFCRLYKVHAKRSGSGEPIVSQQRLRLLLMCTGGQSLAFLLRENVQVYDQVLDMHLFSLEYRRDLVLR